MERSKKTNTGYDEAFKIQMKWHFVVFSHVRTDFELNNLPRRVDLLIIEADESIEKHVKLFKYFKKLNIIEFKSAANPFRMPVDLFKAGVYLNGVFLNMPEAKIEDTTFTIVTSRRPVKLFKQYKPEEIRQGVYRIPSVPIPIHVVVANEVEQSLEGEIGIIRGFSSGKRLREYIRTVLKEGKEDELLNFTRILYKKEVTEIAKREGIEMPAKTWKRMVEEAAEDTGLKEAWLQQGVEQGLQQGVEQGLEQLHQRMEYVVIRALAKGMTVEEISGMTGLTAEEINKLKN